MNNIIKSNRQDSLESVLEAMRAYGRPTLSFIDKGWYCCCNMHVASQGVTFDVASNFNEQSSLAAAQNCMARIKETLNKYKEQ